jgi:hypothetical protein
MHLGVFHFMKTCPHCKKELKAEKEKFIGVCYSCRAFALMYGYWPEQKVDFPNHK